MNIINGKEVDFVRVKPASVIIHFKDKSHVQIKGIDIFVTDPYQDQ